MQSSAQHQTAIKICGLKDIATLNNMNGLPIQYVGLVFAHSRRKVTVVQAVELVQAIHKLDNTLNTKVEAVAVCVDLPITLLKAITEQTKIDIVQLHGQEDKAYISTVKKLMPKTKIWKALSIKKLSQVEQQIKELTTYIAKLDAVVIDAPGGGTGTVFNWDAINSFQQLCQANGCKLLVAGGLHEDNVEQLLSKYNIDGVDVSSGVETDGVKDNDKIQRFVRKVRK